MTNEAKTLYMILLDRRCLSKCNGDVWRDEYGVIFIIFTIKEMMKLLHLGNKKINKMLKELEVHNLIYRSHQGLGKPNKIYVYDFVVGYESGMTMVEIAKRNNVSERTIYRYKAYYNKMKKKEE